MSLLKVGIIGIGNMGSTYVTLLNQGKIEGATLAAVYSRNESRIQWVKEHTTANVQIFGDLDAFLTKSEIDAVIIATPHYSHPELAMKAFSKGLHVMIEKPAGVYTKNVLEMNRAAKDSGKVFGIMYNQRANPLYQKVRDLIHSGELGELRRVNWIVTDVYRSQSYYDSSSWRGTWEGEGGGVLLNQAFHHLDILQWVTGVMPVSVHAKSSFGKYRDIEVEDDVTAVLEYENGTTGVFIASTGETPGTNRLEIVGDKGKLIVENEALIFYQLEQSETEFNASYTGGFGEPKCKQHNYSLNSENDNHPIILQNWINAIVKDEPMLSPGEEGVKALDLLNAIYLSSWLKETVKLPVDPEIYYAKLQEKIATSTFEKKRVSDVTLDVKGTH